MHVSGRQQAERERPADTTADAASESDDWRERWRQAGQRWRTEPPIEDDRRQFLLARHAIAPDIRRGIYPFKDVPLNRADVEWLLAEQKSHGGADDADNDGQVRPERSGGLDLRGADLRHADLSDLPLSGLLGGLSIREWPAARDEQRELAAAHLEGAVLQGTHLEGAVLSGTHLEHADLSGAHLEAAELVSARLDYAALQDGHLEGARASYAHLEQAALEQSHLEGADLHGADLREADLSAARLHGAILRNVRFDGARLLSAHLGGKDVPPDELERLRRWQREFPQQLPPADLRGAVFDEVSDLLGIELGNAEYGWVEVADVRWGDAILTVVDWSGVTMVGDERKAHASLAALAAGGEKWSWGLLAEFETATRANRQLAIALQAQGLAEQASRFTYRAAVIHRKVLWWQLVWGSVDPQQVASGRGHRDLPSDLQKLGAYLVSLVLDAVSGYGQKPMRVLFLYLTAVLSFAVAHYVVGANSKSPADHLTVVDAVVMSVQNLHGRVWAFRSQDPQQRVAAVEAIVGLFIEGTIVAVITRRILGQR